MDIWTIYAFGVMIAFIWFTYDYYMFNLRRGVDKEHILKNPEDLGDIILFSLGSWIAVIYLLFTEEEE